MLRGDAYTLAEWDSALKGYFRRDYIWNSAIKGALAVMTFRGKAERWWSAYMDQYPHRLLAYAQIVEMIRTELVERVDPTTALQAWLQLEYKGRPEQYLKQMDNLMQRFPISPDSLLEMATVPLRPLFAARMREVDQMIPGNATHLSPFEEEHFQLFAHFGATNLHCNATSPITRAPGADASGLCAADGGSERE